MKKLMMLMLFSIQAISAGQVYLFNDNNFPVIFRVGSGAYVVSAKQYRELPTVLPVSVENMRNPNMRGTFELPRGQVGDDEALIYYAQFPQSEQSPFEKMMGNLPGEPNLRVIYTNQPEAILRELQKPEEQGRPSSSSPDNQGLI